MREILFRGGWIKNGEWIEGYYVFLNDTHYILEAGSEDWGVNGEWFQVVPKSVGQFTGLLDKNGKKIFEGDIVDIEREDELFKVEWCEDAARFVLSASTLRCDFDNYWGYEVEIVGNIYDNPELIS